MGEEDMDCMQVRTRESHDAFHSSYKFHMYSYTCWVKTTELLVLSPVPSHFTNRDQFQHEKQTSSALTCVISS